MNLWSVSTLVLFLNVPFGYWRASVRKFSYQWYLSIHIPVPIVIAFRILAGIGWHIVTFPVLIGAFFFGQFLGGKLYRWFAKHIHQSSCLLIDGLKLMSLRLKK